MDCSDAENCGEDKEAKEDKYYSVFHVFLASRNFSCRGGVFFCAGGDGEEGNVEKTIILSTSGEMCNIASFVQCRQRICSSKRLESRTCIIFNIPISTLIREVRPRLLRMVDHARRAVDGSVSSSAATSRADPATQTAERMTRNMKTAALLKPCFKPTRAAMRDAGT